VVNSDFSEAVKNVIRKAIKGEIPSKNENKTEVKL